LQKIHPKLSAQKPPKKHCTKGRKNKVNKSPSKVSKMFFEITLQVDLIGIWTSSGNGCQPGTSRGG
jgi:hypothetical protein